MFSSDPFLQAKPLMLAPVVHRRLCVLHDCNCPLREAFWAVSMAKWPSSATVCFRLMPLISCRKFFVHPSHADLHRSRVAVLRTWSACFCPHMRTYTDLESLYDLLAMIANHTLCVPHSNPLSTDSHACRPLQGPLLAPFSRWPMPSAGHPRIQR